MDSRIMSGNYKLRTGLERFRGNNGTISCNPLTTILAIRLKRGCPGPQLVQSFRQAITAGQARLSEVWGMQKLRLSVHRHDVHSQQLRRPHARLRTPGVTPPPRRRDLRDGS